jgi:hypothetical protein
MKRKVHDNEISEWQNNPQNNPTIRSDAERKAKAQSRKRRQVRAREQDAELWPLYALVLLVALGFMAYIAATH